MTLAAIHSVQLYKMKNEVTILLVFVLLAEAQMEEITNLDKLIEEYTSSEANTVKFTVEKFTSTENSLLETNSTENPANHTQNEPFEQNSTSLNVDQGWSKVLKSPEQTESALVPTSMETVTNSTITDSTVVTTNPKWIKAQESTTTNASNVSNRSKNSSKLLNENTTTERNLLANSLSNQPMTSVAEISTESSSTHVRTMESVSSEMMKKSSTSTESTVFNGIVTGSSTEFSMESFTGNSLKQSNSIESKQPGGSRTLFLITTQTTYTAGTDEMSAEKSSTESATTETSTTERSTTKNMSTEGSITKSTSTEGSTTKSTSTERSITENSTLGTQNPTTEKSKTEEMTRGNDWIQTHLPWRKSQRMTSTEPNLADATQTSGTSSGPTSIKMPNFTSRSSTETTPTDFTSPKSTSAMTSSSRSSTKPTLTATTMQIASKLPEVLLSTNQTSQIRSTEGISDPSSECQQNINKNITSFTLLVSVCTLVAVIVLNTIILLCIWITRRRQSRVPNQINFDLPHIGSALSEISHTEDAVADFAFNGDILPPIDENDAVEEVPVVNHLHTATVSRPNRAHIFTRQFV